MRAPHPATRTLRTRGDRLSVRYAPRAAAVCLLLAAATVAVGLVALTTGDFPLTVAEVGAWLVGRGDGGTDFVVGTLRLPRLLTGLLVGAALGVSGGLFQSLTRNPLGSPDIVGFTTGSATGALVVILLLGGDPSAVALGAVLGGLGTAVLVYVLAVRGGVGGTRLILMGIGVSAILLSVNAYLITRASWQDALAAQSWLIGSLNGRRWEHVVPLAVTLAVLLPLALSLGRRLALLEMGDDAAHALGVPVQRTRLVLVAVGVGLAAVGTAAAGPIGFVALAAPQIARRLTRSTGSGLPSAALTGALLLAGCDLATQRLAPSLPVGIATGAVGGCYLAWLLAHSWRTANR
ncbi:iron chelate uptake ABC transporter family permease subunit [Longispora sp. K20-0274]|uniref:FecCD family ABC transporter permease n=1 Tax=Longispora sp. K20-0274 TaxID=3088255 RepID=UPI00399BF2B9